MNPDRWKQINEVFHAVLDRAYDERKAYLDELSERDSELGAEVCSLLEAHDVSSLFDRPAHEAASALLGERDDDPLLGTDLGPYRVVSTLGRGGMGVVYLGQDTRLHRAVAIKALPTAFTDDARFRARLRQEAMTTAALSHPGIATVYALEEIDQHLYLVREFVAGTTLREMLDDGPLPLKTLVTVAVDVAAALDAAHTTGVVHRDLKPENIMRTAAGMVKVLDFGLARFDPSSSDNAASAPANPDARLTRPGAAIGTPGYMSPEQLRGDRVDFRTDQFSFGVVLYELVTGRHPFGGADPMSTLARVLSRDPPPIIEFRPDCPASLTSVVARCLAKDPADRFASTRMLSERLQTVREELHRQSTPTRALEFELQPSVTHRAHSFWWWKFHQLAVSGIYALMLIPLWSVRASLEGRARDGVFLAAAAVVGWVCTLRLHLFFTAEVYPDELGEQRRRTAKPLAWTDAAFVTVLLVAAAVVATNETWLAALFLMVAVTVGIVSRVIEPATTRAAFSQRSPREHPFAGR